MRTVHPPERLPFNEWFAYIQREIIKDRKEKLRIYEQDFNRKASVYADQRPDRQSLRGAGRIETIDFVELKDNQ